MSEWQDISTAPKDGTKVLVGRFTAGMADRSGIVAIDYWHSRNEHSFEGWGRFNAQYWPPTHWMPIPSPPDLPHSSSPLVGA